MPVAFPTLDSDAKAVQLMRMWLSARLGETVSCIGYYEDSSTAPNTTSMPGASSCVRLPLCIRAENAASHRTFQSGCGIAARRGRERACAGFPFNRPLAEESPMAKLLLVPVLFAIACLFAGIYGAVHNQISYTVCPEYFTQFKFHQFGIENVPDRVGAAIVGWMASWWMGIVIGVVLIPAGFVLRGTQDYFWGMIRVFAVVAGTTLFAGLAALAISYVAVDRDRVGELTRYGNEISDDVAFARAGTMHNFSYLGGLMGVITGGIAVYRQRRRQRNSDPPQSSQTGSPESEHPRPLPCEAKRTRRDRLS
jgi:hypothetical protein